MFVYDRQLEREELWMDRQLHQMAQNAVYCAGPGFSYQKLQSRNLVSLKPSKNFGNAF
jgi:hypothetical protein